MRKYNYITAATMLGLCGYIFLETSSYVYGDTYQARPGFWPRFLAVLLALFSVLLILETIFSKNPEMDKDLIDWKSPGMKKVYKAIGISAAFLLIMETLGMVIALLIMIPTLMYLMGCRNKKMLVVLPICLVSFIYVFFGIIMKVTLPEPFFI